jgi:hypothetical protein
LGAPQLGHRVDSSDRVTREVSRFGVMLPSHDCARGFPTNHDWPAGDGRFCRTARCASCIVPVIPNQTVVQAFFDLFATAFRT